MYKPKYHKSSEEAAKSMASLFVSFLILVGTLLITSVVRLFLLSPLFCSSCVFTFTLLLHYLVNFSSVWHETQQMENRFWMLIGFLLSFSALFLPDSPFHVSSVATFRALEEFGLVSANGCGVMVVGWVVLFVHYIDKYSHRKSLTTTSGRAFARRASVRRLSESIGESGATRLKQVNRLLHDLDYMLPSTVHNMLNLNQVLTREKRLVEVFRDCSKNELNYLVQSTQLKLLVYKIKNHNRKTTLPGLGIISENRHRSELMNLLALERISDLSTSARVIVLDVIQCLRMTKIPDLKSEAEEWIKNIVVRTRGDDLSTLKSLMDTKGSVQSMHKLIYEDVVDNEVRMQLLSHIKNQAAIQQAYTTMGAAYARRRLLKGAWRKILSDVDDTLLSSGGRYPAGIDDSYPHHCLYPGVSCFYKELDFGSHPSVENYKGVWPEGNPGNMVFLSARPHVYKDMVEKSVFSKFEKMIHVNNLHSMPTLLPGDVESGQAYMLRGDYEPMALKKFRNFKEYYSIYPEFTHVFIGDNGQADVKAAEYMVKEFGRKAVETIYVHEVQNRDLTFGYTQDSEKLWKESGIVFFKTYVGAAIHAVTTSKLIRLTGLRRICIAARDDFLKIEFKNAFQAENARIELNTDLKRANEILVKNNMVAAPLIPAKCLYPVGTEVYTRFGKGFVRRFRPVDGIYEVVVEWYKPRNSEGSSVGTNSPMNSPRVRPIELTPTTNTPAVGLRRNSLDKSLEQLENSNVEDDFMLPPSQSESRSPEIISSFDRMRCNPALLYLTLSDLDTGKKALKKINGGSHHGFYKGRRSRETAEHYNIGSHIQTPYGPAVVTRYRAYDNMYEVTMQGFNAKAYFPSNIVYALLQDEESYGRSLVNFMRKLTLTSSGKVYKEERKLAIPVYKIGDCVSTVYGIGKVEQFRESDQVYEIHCLRWNATLFITSKQILGSATEQSESRFLSIMRTLSLGNAPPQNNEKNESNNSRGSRSSSVAYEELTQDELRI